MNTRSNIKVRGGTEVLYQLKGLDCPHCAMKIEDEIKKIDGLSDVNINFATKTIEFDPLFEETVYKIVKRIEPDVQMISQISNRQEAAAVEIEDHEHKIQLYYLIWSALFLALGIFLSPRLHSHYEILEYGIFLIAYFLVGKEVIFNAIRNIGRGEVFDENFLMTIATLGAFAIHQLPEAVAVMLFYSIGEYFQSLAVERSRNSISSLLDIRPDYANLKMEGYTQKVPPEIVEVGDIIVINPGEKVPLDGKVLSGTSYLDTSALTGESVPRKVKMGEPVLAGMVNKDGLLEVKVGKNFGESSVSKILDLVQNAAGRKANTEKFITKFARYYTPVVVIVASFIAFVPPLIIANATFSQWIYRALTILVISCPCALVVSIPLSYFGGIGGASKKGILVKGANFLEALTNIDTVVFDKTGTLTKGVFKVTEIKPAKGFSKEDILKWAAYAESHSSHPIADSILKAYGKSVNEAEIKEYQEIAGQGVKVLVGERQILVGNSELLAKENIKQEPIQAFGTVVHVAVDDRYAGSIIISDEIREDSPKAIRDLKKLGIKDIIMLTGDDDTAAKIVAAKIGIEKYHASLLPEDKVNVLESLKQGTQGTQNKVAFIGDGINDAPVITRADVGMAMGGLGSDAAIEAADVVIMEDMPSKVVDAIKTARFTKKIVMQNVAFALSIKVIFLTLGAFGMASMWMAVFADVGVALLAVLNSTRTLL